MRVTEKLLWRKSTACDTNACVEVAIENETVFIRNSREPQGAVLTFTRAEWDAFVTGVRSGEF